jgi:hypothetical protein
MRNLDRSRNLTAVVVAGLFAACGSAPFSATPLEGASCDKDQVPRLQYYFCPGDDTNVCPARPRCNWTCDGGKWRWGLDIDGGWLGLDSCPEGSIWDYRGCPCSAVSPATCTGSVPGGCGVTCTCTTDASVACEVDYDGGTSCPAWP